MNIQIFGTKKCNETKKAERFFKERGIKYQFVDMKKKGMSKGEFNSVAQANGGLDHMINWEGKDQNLLALIKYIANEDKLEKVLENPQVIKTPVVRNGKQSTLGYQPDVWKKWISMIKFKLKKEQIEFLKKTYPDNKLIQRVLSFEKEGIFEMDDENTYIDFMDYLDDESVAWMDENYDATPQTIMLESIRDVIFCQTNQKRKWTLKITFGKIKQDLIVITVYKILLQEKMDDDLIIITR